MFSQRSHLTEHCHYWQPFNLSVVLLFCYAWYHKTKIIPHNLKIWHRFCYLSADNTCDLAIPFKSHGLCFLHRYFQIVTLAYIPPLYFLKFSGNPHKRHCVGVNTILPLEYKFANIYSSHTPLLLLWNVQSFPVMKTIPVFWYYCFG